MSIQPSTLSDMLGHCNEFIDNKAIKRSDIDLSLIACNGGKRYVTQMSPDKALIRGQLIEVLVRLALDKYLKTGVKETKVEAVEAAFETNFMPFFKDFDCHKWRKETLWREEIDVLLSRFVFHMEMVFKRFCGKYVAPGSKAVTSSLDEFTTMLSQAGLFNEHFAVTQVGPLWNLSMQTRKDELNDEKHLNMVWVEWLEALARVCDKFDIANLVDQFPDYKPKHPTGLDKKIECTCFVLIKQCLGTKHFNNMHSKYKEIVETELENEALGLTTKFKQK